MNYLVILSRLSDRRRKRKIAAFLNDCGQMLCPGVYECEFNENELARLKNELEAQGASPADCVILFHLCKKCAAERLIYGHSIANSSENDLLII